MFQNERNAFPAISEVLWTAYDEGFMGEYAYVDSVAIPNDGNEYIEVFVNSEGAPSTLNELYDWLEHAVNGFVEVQ